MYSVTTCQMDGCNVKAETGDEICVPMHVDSGKFYLQQDCYLQYQLRR